MANGECSVCCGDNVSSSEVARFNDRLMSQGNGFLRCRLGLFTKKENGTQFSLCDKREPNGGVGPASSKSAKKYKVSSKGMNVTDLVPCAIIPTLIK